MKKTFTVTHPKIKTARMFDSIKHEVKKYLKRERNKQLPIEADYWDFDCKYGKTKEVADIIHVTELNKSIESAEAEGLETFYIEIMAKAAVRNVQLGSSEPEDEQA